MVSDMQRAYFPSNELEVYQRPPPRVQSLGCLPDRVHQCSQQDEHFDYGPRPLPILPYRPGQQSPDCDAERNRSTARKRIAVACARCRRRKIKCSGDPGDGTSCSNCKNSSTDPRYCLFTRVGSQVLSFNEHSSMISVNDQPHRMLDHRVSMPILNTRTMESKDMAFYDTCDVRTAHMPTYRHDSIWSMYASQPYAYAAAMPMPMQYPARHDSLPTSTIEHEHAHYHYDAQGYGITHTDNMVAMNLAALGNSLPMHTPTTRRLPVPHHTHVDTNAVYYGPPGVKQATTSISFRPLQTNGHTIPQYQQPIAQRTSSLLPTSAALTEQTQTTQVMNVSEPGFGYQFSTTAPYSPAVSPTTAAVIELSSSSDSSTTGPAEPRPVSRKKKKEVATSSATGRSPRPVVSQRQTYSLEDGPTARQGLLSDFTYEDTREQYSALRHHQQPRKDSMGSSRQQTVDYSQAREQTYRARGSVSTPSGKL